MPRPEYPRPQFVRPEWLCLNGEWQFEIDAGDSGLERGLLNRPLGERITVPFCPESSLSGICHTDFMPAVWYRREVALPAAWAGQRVLLHFQAVDYDATVWVNGVEVGRHRGGFTPFTCDLSGVAGPGERAVIVVRARDTHKEPKPLGKQSTQYANAGCRYTRTTGIWQTVWLEPVPATYLGRARITPDVGRGGFSIQQPVVHPRAGLTLEAVLSDDQGVVSRDSQPLGRDFTPHLELAVPEGRRRLWGPGDPYLYPLTLRLVDEDGQVVDTLESYAGLRGITIEGQTVRLNGEALFQRLVLDQGYYPDGILTAPTEAALVQDIRLGQQAGFNGARLHQKVFEERFLYHADRLGYLVWGEFPDWGCGGFGPPENHQQPGATYITQWLEAIERDYSHPALVGWCPLNETGQPIGDAITVLDDVTRGMFLAAKALDPTRPVLDASGYAHRVPETDIYDSHDYEQEVELFQAHHQDLAQGQPYVNTDPPSQGGLPRRMSLPYGGQPYFVSEFGGAWWEPEAGPGADPGDGPGEGSWGYGERAASVEAWYSRFAGLCQALLGNPHMFGYCYTQLTDVFQEQNGIFTFDRQPKFDLERLRAVQGQKAAIELEGVIP
jgi:beta-galactosidase/beta-glucuronidase